MNIALILKKLSVEGGIQREVLHLAIQLQAMGDNVTVYALHYEKGKGFIDLINQVRVVTLPRQRKARGVAASIELILPSFVAHLLQESRDAYDLACLVDTQTELLNPHHDPVTYKVAYYFKKYVHRIPSVWMMNDFNTKYASFLRSRELYPVRECPTACRGVWRLNTSTGFNAPCEFSNGVYGKKNLSPLMRAGYWLFDTYERLRFIKAQDVIAVLDYHDRDLAIRYLKRDVIVVRQGVEVLQFPFVQHEAPSTRAVRILMIGIFFAHRRFEDAIEALHILTQSGVMCTLTIIGDPTTDQAYAHAITNLVHTYNLDDAVKFSGRVNEQELINAYGSHDIFLFPNHLQSWGLAVFEAMASGIPVIISRTAGASEVLTHGENALIVDPKMPSQIAEAVQRLLNDTSLYADISKKGREFVEHQLSWRQYAENMEKIFRIALTHG